jgi:hypothetical protein
LTCPDTTIDDEEVEYRRRHARRRQLIGALLLFLFVGVPALAFLVIHAVF